MLIVFFSFFSLEDGKTPPFLSNSRDNIQQNSPPRRKSKRNAKKLAAGSSNEKFQVTKSHGKTHDNKIEGGSKMGKNQKGNKSNKNSFTKLPSYRPPPQPQSAPSTEPRLPEIKDYVDMVMIDLSTRPPLWHFSSYGLSLNPIESLPFPHLGTVELSAEELRLQVYAEAAATGGRIDNYVKVVRDIKDKAETVTKALIPDLEKVISETLRANNINMLLDSYQENLRQKLQQRAGLSSAANYSAKGANYPTKGANYPAKGQLVPQEQAYTTTPAIQIPPHEPLLQHPAIQYQLPSQAQQQIQQSNDIIPDDSFAFGMIPEIPPE